MTIQGRQLERRNPFPTPCQAFEGMQRFLLKDRLRRWKTRAHLEKKAGDLNENWRVGSVHFTHLTTKNIVAGCSTCGPTSSAAVKEGEEIGNRAPGLSFPGPSALPRGGLWGGEAQRRALEGLPGTGTSFTCSVGSLSAGEHVVLQAPLGKASWGSFPSVHCTCLHL